MAIQFIQFEDWMSSIADWSQNPEVLMMQQQGDADAVDVTISMQISMTYVSKPKGAQNDCN
jgi:hypothetical protein